MKRNILLLVFFCFNFLFSQKENRTYKDTYFPVKYVLKASKDTIKAQILNIGSYDSTVFSPATYINHITVLDPSGKRLEINETEIKYMEFTDLKKVKRTFVNSKSIVPKVSGLLQVMYIGRKASWYRRSFYNGFIYTNKTSNVDYLITRNSKSIAELHFKLPGLREQIKEKLNASPDLAVQIDEMIDDQDLVKILRLYDRRR